MEVLERLVVAAATGMGKLGGLAATLVVGWKFLAFLFTGDGRALGALLKYVLGIVVVLAVLSNLPETVGMLQTLAGLLFRATVEGIQSATNSAS
jgi:hypothetical protein